MSNVKQCDRCKIIMPFDPWFIEKIKTFTIKLLKFKPASFDFCPDCIEDFVKFKDSPKSEGEEEK